VRQCETIIKPMTVTIVEIANAIMLNVLVQARTLQLTIIAMGEMVIPTHGNKHRIAANTAVEVLIQGSRCRT
jgi:hypothetical protein